MTRPSEVTRERIMKAAERLFAERGYDGTSVRAIVAKARVNQAAINYHFDGKEGLYRADNGKEVYKFGGNRGYDFDAGRFDVELKKGKNLLMVKCGNGGGPWQYSVAVTGLAAEHRDVEVVGLVLPVSGGAILAARVDGEPELADRQTVARRAQVGILGEVPGQYDSVDIHARSSFPERI